MGHRTSYSYSPSGQLSSRTDPDGAVWRYEHTTAGRLSAVVDPTGARTEIERGPHGEEVRSIDPLGREVTRRLDDLGNVATVVLPDGARWQYHHDAMSRLTEAVDPAGHTWTMHHDEVGAPTLTVDPTGVRRTVSADRHQRVVSVDDGLVTTSTRFDPLGRAVEEQRADGSASLVSYDLCGRPVELVDAEGGLTRVRRDAAGRPVEVVTPSGATTRHEYDRCGRLVATVDPSGARTTREYDADGRLVRQVLPTGDVAWAEHDPCGRLTALSRPGRGVARYRYDAAGRVVAASDTWFGRRRFRYDAAGQLVEVVNGNGGVTRYDHDANGRAVAITDPLGHTTRREFDVMNRCIAETDPLGRTTRAGYDGAGRQVWQEDPAGRRTTWRHDASGRVSATLVDGVTASAVERDVRGRSVTVQDHTAPHGRTVTHHLEYDRRGQLVRRSRDGRSVSWSYDADGRRTSMTTPDGHRTGYTWDAAGRLVALDHPLLGRAVFVRDAAGRLVEATAGDLVQTWDHRDGYVVAHTVGDPDGFTRTLIGRDEDGRVTSIERDAVLTHYEHDGAQQLVEARTEGSVTRWHFDAAGRLVGESADGVTREHSYDAAGQLVSTREPGGGTTTHAYDELGRRTRTSTADDVVRDYAWSATGRLAGVTAMGPEGTWQVPVHVDALGEIAEVGGTELFWDRAAPYSPAPVQAGGLPIVPAGVVTGIGDTWAAPGWRAGRPETADPWGGAGAAGPHGTSDLSLDPSGGLHVAGLELLGARAYDPASRGFLSVDPLDPVPGAGWAGNPYSYAGNDPLHAVDPTGLRPVTDAELQAYIASHQGALAAAGDWVSDNWEYLAGGAMVVAGGVLIATGVGGPAGMMLVGAGADVIIQKATTGGVNWGQVAVMGAAGGLGGAAAAARWGTTGLRAAVATGAASGASAGGAGGAYTYATGPGPHTPAGLLQATTQGTLFGGVTGGAGGAVGHGLSTLGGRVLGNVAPDPVPEHVFWSGGPVAKDAAEEFARATNRTTLEMTPQGHALERTTADMDWADAEPLWQVASKEFAEGAQGTAHVFHNANGVRIESVWAQQEYPILRDNGVNIEYHVAGGP